MGCSAFSRCSGVSAVVDAVAAEAADVGLGMRRAIEVRVRAGVAAQAGVIDLFGAQLAEAANLRDIATALDVGLARSVAAFAGHALAGMFESETGMRIVVPVNFFTTSA